ncbi:MAG: DUF58 domain-containing protein [Ilumatobacteraceae bacterium]
MAVVAATRDPRAAGYVTLTVTLALIALLIGQPILLAGAAPFVVALVRGLADQRPTHIDLVAAASTFSPLEGDRVTVTLRFTRRPTQLANVHVSLASLWAEPQPADLTWAIAPGDELVEITFTVVAKAWGRTGLGDIVIDLTTPGGLVHWELSSTPTVSFRVLPPPERVRELLPPPISHSSIGQHVSRMVGDGYDFAELRPYANGDRLRDINWRASARFDSPQVNRRHPERNGDVMLLLDTFADATGTHSETMQAVLGRAGRAAWSIAQLHFNAQDRVGLAARGRVVRQLRIGGGDRSRYTLLETLLSIGGQVAGSDGLPDIPRRGTIPQTALVVALTPLIDVRMVNELLALRGSGHRLVVVVVEVMDLLPEATSAADQMARRLYASQLQLQRDRISSEGIPLTLWRDDSSLSQVVGSLRNLQRARLVRR